MNNLKSYSFLFEVGLILLSVFITLWMAIFPISGVFYSNSLFCIYILILMVNYLREKRFNLYQIWIVAYIFMVWAEMRILVVNDPNMMIYSKPFIRFSLSNACVLLGYHCNRNTVCGNKMVWIEKGSKKTSFFLIIFILELIYVYSSLSVVRTVMYGQRGSGSAMGGGSLGGSFTNAIGLILPAFIAYYYKYIEKKNIFWGLLVASPIFIMLFLRATRYKFLFSVLPFLVVFGIFNVKESRLRNNVLLLISVFLMIEATSFVKDNRSKSFDDWGNFQLFSFDDLNNSDEPFTLKVAKEMSPEGVIGMADMADDYFKEHQLHWGKETAFILYFWVPRKVWPNKPTMLDSWLVREYTNVSEGFSSASGFIGELRADFGWGCLFFMFLFGLLIKRLDNYSSFIYRNDCPSFNMVLVAVFFPWLFFFVRSPITSTMAMIWEIILYYILCKCFAVKEEINID